MLYTMYNPEHPELSLYPPGACMYLKNGIYVLSDARLIPSACFITEDKQIAKDGDIIVYGFWPSSLYHLNDYICSAPSGLVDLMRKSEIEKYPNAILGSVKQIIDNEHILIHLNCNM